MIAWVLIVSFCVADPELTWRCEGPGVDAAMSTPMTEAACLSQKQTILDLGIKREGTLLRLWCAPAPTTEA